MPAHSAFERDALSILVAEDNEANRRVLVTMLDELGLTADVVVNGAEAVARAKTRDYDVILMDVRMPVLDGLQAIAQIRALPSASRPAIFALTANVLPGEEARCVEAGMDGYLTKPLRLETLAAILQGVASKMRTT